MAEYDVIGDVHGCLHTLRRLLGELGYDEEGRHARGRRLAFVGDIVNRGLHGEEAFLYVMRLIGVGRASSVRGNQDVTWVEQHTQYERWLFSMPLQLLVDEGRLLIVHAAASSAVIGRSDAEGDGLVLDTGRMRLEWTL